MTETNSDATPLTIVAAVARNGVIGVDGGMPFHIPSDLRHFRSVTMGHPVIMGRRTFESLPKGALPGRRNIVVTRNREFTAPNVETAPSLEMAIAMCATDAVEPMIIGGGEIYRQAMPLATTLEITAIDADAPAGDTFFPEIAAESWELARTSGSVTDEHSSIPLEFRTYTRR